MVGFVDARLYFAADDGSSGIELWKSDGTAAGTAMVADIGQGAPGSIPEELTPMVEPFQAATSRLFFSAATILGRELCAIGPHPVHALQILDVRPWDGSGNPRDLAVERGPSPRLLFAADAGDGSGHEPWTTLGTPATTRRVADLNRRRGAGSDPRGLTPTAYGWLMSADDGVHGREVWLHGPLRGLAVERGTGCGAAPPTLQAPPPRIGVTLRVTGRPGPGGSVGALMLNAPRPGAVRQLFGCGYTFDPITSFLVPIPGQDSDWSLDLPIPDAPWLVDQQIDSRALFVSIAPFDLNVSPAVLLAIGR
jgi:ELWxxDGT repeat protein